MNWIKRKWSETWALIEYGSRPECRYTLRRLRWLLALFIFVTLQGSLAVLGAVQRYAEGTFPLGWVALTLVCLVIDLSVLRWHVLKYLQQRAIIRREREAAEFVALMQRKWRR